MSWMGEQGEQFGRFPLWFPRLSGNDWNTAQVLTLLTPVPRLVRKGKGHERGGFA
jgi:hypothetical protein